MSEYHISVLLQEVLDGLQVRPGEKYIDGTLGAAGHALAICQKGGLVLGIDQDEDSIAYVKEHAKDTRLTVVKGNFANMADIAQTNGFGNVSGILLDLGISSHHVDEGSRGFSFLQEAPLDMRMDRSLAVTAKDLVNGLHKGELTELFTKYGEERFAKRIAEAIVTARQSKPIETTRELAAIVARCYPRGEHKVHPATKVFQALRIAVNDELHALESVLPQAVNLLEPHGRLAVISFHSLEDRIVKLAFEAFEKKGLGEIITKKPIEPSLEEQEDNRRSRSSKLRIFEKL